HFEQVFRVARKAGIAPPDVVLEHVKFGTMNGPDGKPFKTREGGVVSLRDLIDMVTGAAIARLDEAEIAQEYPPDERREIARRVGLAALKFGELQNHRTSNYVFDLDRFLSFDGKTGPYLQYGVVRTGSVLKEAAARDLSPGLLVAPTIDQERDLMLALLRFPEIVERSWEFRAPNHLAEYAFEVTQQFNRFYEECHILSEPDEERQASWLRLIDLTGRLLTTTLELLGISVPERM
ncbi:MAG: arginine--tRNA ligase, partial [Acidimicrobiia bacterium]|nr:arginine--tRNA ligase [Acidimicrobiia bacterium]